MKKRILSSVGLIAILLVGLGIYQNCSPEYRMNSVTKNGDSIVPGTGTPVCDPNDPKVFKPQNGLVAELYYLTSPSHYTQRLAPFLSSLATKSTSNLYFNNINVPTQYWDKGFKKQDGTLLKNDANQTLLEYFALKYFGYVGVTQTADEGYYQFAVLSDDGAIVDIEVDNNWETFVNNDTDNPTKMGCGIKTVKLEKDRPVGLRYYYFQGPRTELANIFLWRKVPATSTVGTGGHVVVGSIDQECGKSTLNYFYNAATSQPTAVMTGLASRGWGIVPYENLFLPTSMVSPCAPSTSGTPSTSTPAI